MLHVKKYDKNCFNDWERFIANSKNSSFLFSRNFMEYHSDRFTDSSLIVKHDINTVAVFPANITNDNVVVSHQGLTYGGLVVKKEEKLVDVIVFFREILKYLHTSGIETLRYKEIPSFYNDIPSDEMQYAFFLAEAKLIGRDACSMIKNSFRLPYQKRRRAAIKNAKEEGVEIRFDNDFDVFWNEILIPNLMTRHNTEPVHSLAEIKALYEKFPKNIRQINAYLNNKIMAGVTIFETNTVARGQYTSGSAEGRRNGSLDLLFDIVINETYKDKPFFDFGNSNESLGKVLKQGLLEWKEGFGGRTYSHNFYEVKTANYVLLDKVAQEGGYPL